MSDQALTITISRSLIVYQSGESVQGDDTGPQKSNIIFAGLGANCCLQRNIEAAGERDAFLRSHNGLMLGHLFATSLLD